MDGQARLSTRNEIWRRGATVPCPKSLYISRAVSLFYLTEYETWAGFGLVGCNENFGN
jgi:hypothetical protein